MAAIRPARRLESHCAQDTRVVRLYASGQAPASSTPVHHVNYIGVAGIGKDLRSGIRGRLKSHHRNRKDWTHYSFFEVHDNITREEIRELESLLLAIFRHDPRISLENKQKGFGNLYQLRKKAAWSVSG